MGLNDSHPLGKHRIFVKEETFPTGIHHKSLRYLWHRTCLHHTACSIWPWSSWLLREATRGNRSWWRCWLDIEYTWVQIPVPSLSHYGLTHTEVSVNHFTQCFMGYLFLLDSELFESKNIFSFILVSFMLTTSPWWGNKCFPENKLIHSGEGNKWQPLDPMSLTLQGRAGDWDSAWPCELT